MNTIHCIFYHICHHQTIQASIKLSYRFGFCQKPFTIYLYSHMSSPNIQAAIKLSYRFGFCQKLFTLRCIFYHICHHQSSRLPYKAFLYVRILSKTIHYSMNTIHRIFYHICHHQTIKASIKLSYRFGSCQKPFIIFSHHHFKS